MIKLYGKVTSTKSALIPRTFLIDFLITMLILQRIYFCFEHVIPRNVSYTKVVNSKYLNKSY